MYDRISELLESNGHIIDNNGEMIVEATDLINDFRKDAKSFVLTHPEEFIGESVDDTYKNIRVFTEVATSQFVTEISNLYGNVINENEIIDEEGINEYL